MVRQKSILITGTSSGIGRATARRLKAAGWRVFAACRRNTDATDLQAEGFETVQMDVVDDTAVQAAFNDVLNRTGGTLDAVFCNAGFSQSGAVEDIAREALVRQFETNVFGTWSCVRYAMAAFRRQGYGRLLVTSSIVGFTGVPWRGAYNASKYALEGMCDTLRNEAAGSNIRISLIEPGPVASEFRPTAARQLTEGVDIATSVHRDLYESQIARLEQEGGDTVPFTQTADAVAAVCERALNARRPRARYPVGLPTHASWWGKRLLPVGVFDFLVRRSARLDGRP